MDDTRTAIPTQLIHIRIGSREYNETNIVAALKHHDVLLGLLERLADNFDEEANKAHNLAQHIRQQIQEVSNT